MPPIVTFLLIVALMVIFLVMYFIASSLNPASVCDIRKVAVLRTFNKTKGKYTYKLVKAKTLILRDFKYSGNMNHVTNKTYTDMYLFDRFNALYHYESGSDIVRRVNKDKTITFLDTFKSNFFDIYNFFSINRFKSLVVEDMERERK